MKKNIRKKRILVVSLIVLLIIALFYLMSGNSKRKIQNQKQEAKSGETYEYYEEKIFPAGIAKLKYLYTKNEGTLNQENYYKQLYLFANYLNELYKISLENDEKQLEKYFDENNNIIKNNTGIRDKDSFLEIEKYLKNIDILEKDFGEYKSSSIDVNNIIFQENICVFDTTIKYTNYENGVKFKTYFNLDNNISYDTNNVYFKVD